jgi:hypothetical protein
MAGNQPENLQNTDFDPLAPLPHPEERPAAEWSTLQFLDGLAADGGMLPLWALRISRSLLNEPSIHMRDLLTLWHRWRVAREAPEATAQFAALATQQVSGSLPVTPLAALGQAALSASPERAKRMCAFSLLLRAVVYHFRFQAHSFGLFHRITNDSTVRGQMLTPTGLLHARNYAIGGRPLVYVGSHISDAMLPHLMNMMRCVRLRVDDKELLAALRRCVEQGMSPCVEFESRALLIATVSRDCEELSFFDPVTGRTLVCTRAEFDELVEHIKTLTFLDGDLAAYDEIGG